MTGCWLCTEPRGDLSLILMLVGLRQQSSLGSPLASICSQSTQRHTAKRENSVAFPQVLTEKLTGSRRQLPCQCRLTGLGFTCQWQSLCAVLCPARLTGLPSRFRQSLRAQFAFLIGAELRMKDLRFDRQNPRSFCPFRSPEVSGLAARVCLRPLQRTAPGAPTDSSPAPGMTVVKAAADA